VHKIQVTPYVSAEAFYDGEKHSWDEEQYATGIQLPYKRLIQMDIYYLRQEALAARPEMQTLRD
jgi:hypothetical protein